MLKIGDKVRAKVSERSKITGEFFFKKGWTGVVTRILDNDYYVDWRENPDYLDDGYWYILIKDAEPA